MSPSAGTAPLCPSFLHTLRHTLLNRAHTHPPGTRRVLTYEGCGEKTSEKKYWSLFFSFFLSPSHYLYYPKEVHTGSAFISTLFPFWGDSTDNWRRRATILCLASVLTTTKFVVVRYLSLSLDFTEGKNDWFNGEYAWQFCFIMISGRVIQNLLLFALHWIIAWYFYQSSIFSGSWWGGTFIS